MDQDGDRLFRMSLDCDTPLPRLDPVRAKMAGIRGWKSADCSGNSIKNRPSIGPTLRLVSALGSGDRTLRHGCVVGSTGTSVQRRGWDGEIALTGVVLEVALRAVLHSRGVDG
jgi:hypothetical protein